MTARPARTRTNRVAFARTRQIAALAAASIPRGWRAARARGDACVTRLGRAERS